MRIVGEDVVFHGKQACFPYKNNCARRGSNAQPTAPPAAVSPALAIGVLEAAVGLLVGQAIIINRLTGVRYPFWASVPTPKIGALASHGGLQRFTRFLWLG